MSFKYSYFYFISSAFAPDIQGVKISLDTSCQSILNLLKWIFLTNNSCIFSFIHLFEVGVRCTYFCTNFKLDGQKQNGLQKACKTSSIFGVWLASFILEDLDEIVMSKYVNMKWFCTPVLLSGWLSTKFVSEGWFSSIWGRFNLMCLCLEKGVAGPSTHQLSAALQRDCAHDQGWGCFLTLCILSYS